ncbi:2'-5' RNA ligase [Halanaerobium saccharolyticum]|jgi:2'-5' RNA ligase|uniref:RNA 2',3'-cyclic phosphodiesterase n=1 Tax=Halanaerobium saccharolyticum TaxID=43595 RepID=A0A2T5RPF4_9FIRM|nr:RNA 2',3'-cyclic phosphodiesterase [Halanaerobium saccharolyticum]PTW01709.1 2'-5' RNA ligase [Halanaerobium saccharolyticum]TDP94190.1 2'-5' RNA ligase [Halanaerobium saccharolyticum]
MRLFIAADINSRSKDLIENKLNYIKTEIKNDIKWTEKDKWHLTLKFIGESSTQEKENLIKVLKNIDFKEKNEYIQFAKFDAFPSPDSARVIYLGLDRGEKELIELQQRLENELIKYGFEKDERDYIPHLTLGRNKGEAFKIKKELLAPNLFNIYARIESITLYQSQLKKSGPEYIELFSIK